MLVFNLLQAQLAVAEKRGAAAAAEAEAAQKLSAERELLLVAVAPSNGDIGDDAVRPPLRPSTTPAIKESSLPFLVLQGSHYSDAANHLNRMLLRMPLQIFAVLS